MEAVFGTAAAAAGLFAGTNIDDLVVPGRITTRTGSWLMTDDALTNTLEQERTPPQQQC